MRINLNKIKDYSMIAAKILGIIIGCALFWFVVIEFMWACYYAGIPM